LKNNNHILSEIIKNQCYKKLSLSALQKLATLSENFHIFSLYIFFALFFDSAKDNFL